MNNRDREDALTLEILSAIDERSDLTQRSLASRTGVALGLANSYLKRCVKKGLIKIQQAPANRYLYYLTPKGFAEKSRLTAQYLSFSFSFYRQAGNSCARAFHFCLDRGWTRIGLYGASDLAEIAAIRAMETKIEIVAVCDPASDRSHILNVPVVTEIEKVADVDVWLVTDLSDPPGSRAEISRAWPEQNIVTPDILGNPWAN